jgi:uncharacterized protein (DUF736 family)
MGYNIGFFKATDTGYTGTIETLAHKLKVDFHRVLNRTNSKAPAIELYVGDLKIAAAWEYTGKYGKFFKVSFEDPSFSAGEYFFNRNRGVDDGWTLSFERTTRKKQDSAPAEQAA